MDTEVCEVLMVDDDADEAEFFETAIDATGVGIRLYHCLNYKELIAHLNKEGFPDLIIMDINLPGKNGVEMVNELKSNPEYSSIPVITVSNAFNDKVKADSLGAGAFDFMVKPTGMDEYIDTVKKLHGFCNSLKKKVG